MGFIALVAEFLLGALAWWTIAIGNLLATAAMGWWLSLGRAPRMKTILNAPSWQRWSCRNG